jgi:hypothetical protein
MCDGNCDKCLKPIFPGDLMQPKWTIKLRNGRFVRYGFGKPKIATVGIDVQKYSTIEIECNQEPPVYA